MTAEKPIKPDRLLKELSEIWTTMAAPEASGATDEAHGDGVLRACAMTLFSFVDDEEDSTALGDILAHLMKEHPSRSVVVRLREGEDFLDARAFAQCWMPFGHGRQICCEQVEITASMNRLADVAAIVGPLAVPDLPRVILLRSARIVRAGALRKILPLGDKIIVDSARSGAPGFGELGGLLDAGHVTGDLAWARITDLRALIAQLLEHRTVNRIVIEYAGREASRETRYLLAWLESSLCSAKVGLKGSGEDGAGNVSAVLVDSDLSIRITDKAAEYAIGGLHQRAAFSPGTDEELLNVELGIVGHDPVFERALNRITA
ncbi:MAG TPA: glucose-6-phosphate dehydrogenase assembly protein OpcA [Bryobacteraceae bacterium]|nr:glucose-6-phosphate dehydrogenase assembly protein OpcA [Bryobacteraceae bacterium]